jgi:hypothetical protein
MHFAIRKLRERENLCSLFSANQKGCPSLYVRQNLSYLFGNGCYSNAVKHDRLSLSSFNKLKHIDKESTFF